MVSAVETIPPASGPDPATAYSKPNSGVTAASTKPTPTTMPASAISTALHCCRITDSGIKDPMCTISAGWINAPRATIVEVSTRSAGMMPAFAKTNTPNMATSRAGTRAFDHRETSSPRAMKASTMAAARMGAMGRPFCGSAREAGSPG